MKIEGSILNLIGTRIFDAPYTGEDANLDELKHEIIDLIKRSWKFYNDFLDAENTSELSKLELYGASQIASNDIVIDLFYRNCVSIEDCLYHLYFKKFLEMVDTWSIHRGEIDSFKEYVHTFEDKYGEDLTKICLLVGIYIESLDARYMHIKEYAYYSFYFLDDEKELENFRQSSHYGYVVNHLPKIDVSTADSYENMTEDELIDEFVKFGIENTKMRDKIFENE